MIRPLLMACAICTALSIPLSSPAQTPAAAPASATASAATPAKRTLDALFASEWQRGLRDSPENASYSGDARYNDLWTDASPAAISSREAADRAALAALKAIDRASLASADLLNYDTFAWQLEHSVARQRFREWQQPVGHQGGPQTLDGIAEILPFKTEKDYTDWLARLRAVPTVVAQAQALMADGVKAGNMPPKVLMERVPAQIALQVVDDATKSPFYRPFLRMPDGIPAARAAALQAEAKDLITKTVVPAYRTFGTYFSNDYLPKTRASIAVTDLPDGRAYYDFLAGYYTTTDLTADQIHAIGLKEVARIGAQMEKVKAQAGFEGSMAEFFTFLRSDPQFFEKTPAALLQRYRATAKRIDPELVKVFRIIPRAPYGVRPIPDNIAPDTTTAYYQPGAGDGTRPGYYYVNLYKPETRPTWEMIPLSLHEAVPGHHFQFARGLELPDAPEFRRNAYFVAYGEGWGLYAEQLGTEMGLYDDPYDRMGQLAYEMWRAVRLVVDTGMHSKGWSRDRAIEYFMANTPKTRQDAVNEIDRYIGTPAQALAYKIGQMKISQLRAKATQALGPAFDLRDFNDAALETGSVPLDALERHIDAWIAATKAGPSGKAASLPAR